MSEPTPVHGGSTAGAPTFTTESAVIIVCDACGKRSGLLDPAQVAVWQERHAAHHRRIERRVRLAAQGHAVDEVLDWMTNDDSSGHAECSCGWRSRDVKACNADRLAERHLDDVEAANA